MFSTRLSSERMDRTGSCTAPRPTIRPGHGLYRLALLTHNVIIWTVIRDFADKETERVFRRQRVPSLAPDLQRRVHRKLLLLDAAESLEDLRVPPGNRLELLRGDRSGQHSIRVNDRWRICFRWEGDGPHEVELVDYHRGRV